LAKASLKVIVASNIPIVICLGYQSDLMKLMTKENISFAPLDIHKSKLVVDI
jgi:hypothetical protein